MDVEHQKKREIMRELMPILSPAALLGLKVPASVGVGIELVTLTYLNGESLRNIGSH